MAAPLLLVSIGSSLSSSRYGRWPLQIIRGFAPGSRRSLRHISLAIPGSVSGAANSYGEGGLVMASKALELRPDVVTVEYGMNDAWTGNGISVAQFGANLSTIADTLKAFLPGDRILFMTMNPVPNPPTTTDGSQRSSLPLYYDEVRTRAAAKGVSLIDCAAAYGTITVAETQNGDNVHPTDAAAARGATPAILTALAPFLR